MESELLPCPACGCAGRMMHPDKAPIGEKTFEVRKNDRDFKAGDRLLLREWDEDLRYTGREQLVDVLYRMPGGRWGIAADHCVMAIRLCPSWLVPVQPTAPPDGGEPTCNLCGEPMPKGEEMFKYHGYSGPCPVKPPEAAAPNPPTISESSPEPSDARLIREWQASGRHEYEAAGDALAERLRVRGEELANLREVNGISYRGAEQFAAERNKAEAALSSRDATIAELRQEIERMKQEMETMYTDRNRDVGINP